MSHTTLVLALVMTALSFKYGVIDSYANAKRVSIVSVYSVSK